LCPAQNPIMNRHPSFLSSRFARGALFSIPKRLSSFSPPPPSSHRSFFSLGNLEVVSQLHVLTPSIRSTLTVFLPPALRIPPRFCFRLQPLVPLLGSRAGPLQFLYLASSPTPPTPTYALFVHAFSLSNEDNLRALFFFSFFLPPRFPLSLPFDRAAFYSFLRQPDGK